MIDQLLQTFGQSAQGQQAYNQLQAQGYTPQQSAGILTTAFPAAVAAVKDAFTGNTQGGLGLLQVNQSNYATNFLTAAVTGLVRGQGLKGAAIDGIQGVAGGHVAQVIASRCGLPQNVAGVVGALITPPMIDFLWDKFQAMQASGGIQGLLGGGGAAPNPAQAPRPPRSQGGFGCPRSAPSRADRPPPLTTPANHPPGGGGGGGGGGTKRRCGGLGCLRARVFDRDATTWRWPIGPFTLRQRLDHVMFSTGAFECLRAGDGGAPTRRAGCRARWRLVCAWAKVHSST